MEYVCDDRDSKWYYNPEKQSYHRVYDCGDTAFIFGKYLPDPDLLHHQRMANAERNGGRVNVEKMKPTPATYALFSHYKSVCNA